MNYFMRYIVLMKYYVKLIHLYLDLELISKFLKRIHLNSIIVYILSVIHVYFTQMMKQMLLFIVNMMIFKIHRINFSPVNSLSKFKKFRQLYNDN